MSDSENGHDRIDELEEKIERMNQSGSAPKVEIATGGAGMITTGGTAVTVEGKNSDSTEEVRDIAIEAFASVLSEEAKSEWRVENR